ncbi:MAG: PKD domain-containing protein [Chloroflexota bacterium]|nr:PKD domain-containing protein [Chloroflexota bacterium]
MTIGTIARTLVVLLVVTVSTVSSPSKADAKDPTPPPPITLPPAAETTGAPTLASPCGGWYLTSTYGPRWPTTSTWWQSDCPRVGAYDESMPIWDDFFYWDGAQSVGYGQWWTEPYQTWDGHDPCSYWSDTAAAQWYGPYACTAETNASPVASFTVICTALKCTVDGSASHDTDGTITDYLWYFGDGTDPVTGATAEHVFAQARTYTVSLMVTDDIGSTGYSATDVTVAAIAPTAAFSVLCSGLRCDVDGGGSIAASGTIQSYSWQFGDGAGASGASTATHLYGASGAYTITLTVSDSSGTTANASKVVSITNLAPTAAFGGVCSGLTCTLDARASSDPDGTIASYTWQFGDGAGATTSTPTAVHAYTRPGTYTVALTVTDNNGASATASRSLLVITLTAKGYKVSGAQMVDLSWTSPSGATADVYRNAVKIATLQATSYTDALGKAARGDYLYKVCVGPSSCSNEVTVRL